MHHRSARDEKPSTRNPRALVIALAIMTCACKPPTGASAGGSPGPTLPKFTQGNSSGLRKDTGGGDSKKKGTGKFSSGTGASGSGAASKCKSQEKGCDGSDDQTGPQRWLGNSSASRRDSGGTTLSDWTGGKSQEAAWKRVKDAWKEVEEAREQEKKGPNDESRTDAINEAKTKYEREFDNYQRLTERYGWSSPSVF